MEQIGLISGTNLNIGDISLISKKIIKKEEIQGLENVDSAVEHLLTQSLDFNALGKLQECVQMVEAVLDVTWEELNTGHWSLVPPSKRTIYSVASLIKVVALVQQCEGLPADQALSCLEQAVKTADMGLLLGNSHRDQLTDAARILSHAIHPLVDRCKREGAEPAGSGRGAPELRVPVDPVCELHCPSLETFSSQHFYPRLPVKLTGCMNHWVALRRWGDMDYLLAAAGSRTVPVELGASYSQADWSQRLMPLHQFIQTHILNSGRADASGVGYLAQHQLFDQVPELKQDIATPDYCACSEVDGEGEVDINAWFGPCGTVSPLHFDPKHNLLCQVVGRKRVVLYAPSSSDRLYPHEGRLLSNTAQVDPEAPDFSTFPRYRDTQAFLCYLTPGEMLYIPPTWWHHVRALDVSFSVSFWWE